jgi:hypothetical protein
MGISEIVVHAFINLLEKGFNPFVDFIMTTPMTMKDGRAFIAGSGSSSVKL